jgi:hypothetical protein
MTGASLDAAALMRRLHEADVLYIVIGGFAVIAHGVVRATKDLDIVPEPSLDNLTRLADLLDALGSEHIGVGDFDQREFPFDPTDPGQLAEGGNFRLETSLGSLDVMQWVPGIAGDHAYNELAEHAITGEIHGVPVRVCGLEHLRLMKGAAARPQDLQDLRDLESAHPDQSG